MLFNVQLTCMLVFFSCFKIEVLIYYMGMSVSIES